MHTDFRNVRFLSGFWKDKTDLNRTVTIPAVYDRFKESGRIDAFRCDWKEGMPNKPHYFWDSDVAKWMESAAYSMAQNPDPELLKKCEAIIDQIEANQHSDGYFNIYFTVVEPDRRWADRNCHELYCAGHLMEAACAFHDAGLGDRLLNIMKKYADYIARVFMVEHSAGFNTPGHEEIELALYKMYRTTGEHRFMDLCAWFLENRGQPSNKESAIFNVGRYAQSHLPIRDQHEAFGHSVRAMYLYSAMADYARETDDAALKKACLDLFDDVVRKKMYITGGIGSTNLGEAFTIAYDLPENKAYTETCASIGMIFFAQRLFLLDPENGARYGDIAELELYNGALSGLSLSGDHFFYENPLEIYLRERNRITATQDVEKWPITQRVKSFGCSCCPPNITRLLASLGEYFYACSETGHEVYIQQFADSEYRSGDISVRQETDYPLSGRIHITANVPVAIRIPGWSRLVHASAPYTLQNGYARFTASDFTIELDMTPRLIVANPQVVRALDTAALRCGPFIYCTEGIDNNNDVHTLYFDQKRIHEAYFSSGKGEGVRHLCVKGFRRLPVSDDLYTELKENFIPTDIHLIPYYAFANRGETDMKVFLHYR